jgi:hypothetical protein
MTASRLSIQAEGVASEKRSPKIPTIRAGKMRLAKVNQVANVASLLCMIDCTALPVIMVAMQLVGLTSSSNMECLHRWGHLAAVYFVLPVGGLAAASNFLSHRKPRVSLFALLGLLLIYASNGTGGPLKLLPHAVRHQLHCGTLVHRLVNIVGCALLIGSNYRSHKLLQRKGKCCGGPTPCLGA